MSPTHTARGRSPDTVEPYREPVVGLMRAVAEAKGGKSPVESPDQVLVEDALAG